MDKRELAEAVIIIGLILPLFWVISFRRTIGLALAAALVWYSGRHLYEWYETGGAADIGQPWLLAAYAAALVAGCALAVVTWRTKVH